jgi:hypothetical protein
MMMERRNQKELSRMGITMGNGQVGMRMDRSIQKGLSRMIITMGNGLLGMRMVKNIQREFTRREMLFQKNVGMKLGMNVNV